VTNWRANLLEDDRVVAEILATARRIAVLGIKIERQAHRPAFFVPRYLQQAGYEIIPVPVYFPDVTRILGQPVFRRVADIPGEVDVVEVFRRPRDIPPHVPDLVQKRPRAVWFQSGIRNDEAASELARAGILVVQDRCMMVEHGRLVAS
jgi:predicted CoA-binding protein